MHSKSVRPCQASGAAFIALLKLPNACFFHATRTYVRTGSQMLTLEKSPEKSSRLNVGHACYLVVCFI